MSIDGVVLLSIDFWFTLSITVAWRVSIDSSLVDLRIVHKPTGSFFEAEDVNYILAMRISKMGRKDSYVWNHSKSGIYTVRMGYRVATEERGYSIVSKRTSSISSFHIGVDEDDLVVLSQLPKTKLVVVPFAISLCFSFWIPDHLNGIDLPLSGSQAWCSVIESSTSITRSRVEPDMQMLCAAVIAPHT
ncbi:hypothetical protein F2Q70_00040308 [Brassica cretica]|uniref:Uncharacterized protein n=1 Tax=Brassica cretica TaxID=69181 RepID=A0A8S9K7B1_BRACR|nr:hypothetical protein F2Q70_00040308 [Brassica cretica]